MGLFDRLIENRVTAAVRSALAVVENENNFLLGTRSLTGSDRDRYTYDRKEILEQSLEAWRTNPLARRIVELTISICCRRRASRSTARMKARLHSLILFGITG